MKRWILLFGILITAFFVTLAIAGSNSTVTRGKTFTSTETVTHTKLHSLVDDADVTGLKLGAFGSTIRPITIAATAPSSPTEGDFWYDTSTLLLKQSRSSVWVTLPNIVYLGAESTDPDTVSGKGIVYQKNTGGIPTLYFRPDATGTAVRITDSTGIDSSQVVRLTGAQTVAGEKTWSDTQNFNEDTVFDSAYTHGLDAYTAPTADAQFAPKKYVDDLTQIDTAIGVSDISTTSATDTDMADMTYTDTFTAGNVFVIAKIPTYQLNTSFVVCVLFVDDVAKDTTVAQVASAGGNYYSTQVLMWSGAVSADSHTIEIKWKVNTGTAYQYGTTYPRVLTIIRNLN